MEVPHSRHFHFSVGHVMKIVRIIVPLAFVVFLIGYAKELRHLMNEGGWPELAVALICFGGILMCYGVALMPITSKVRAVATYVSNDVAPMKKLRDVPLRYRVVALACGGISLFLFGVVFAVLRQAYRTSPNSAWAWEVLAALVAVVAAAGACFGLVAWAALSDPKSRLGSWFGKKAADILSSLSSAALECLMWVGFFLISLAGSYDIFLGVAAFFCCVLLFLPIVRRALKSDIEAPDDPNDNPRANRLIGKSRERGSYDYRD
jgi:hypothetical protein